MTLETKKPAIKTRMTRAQIAQALDQIPVGVLLTGTGKKSTLTTKQKAFAHQVAMGETKAGAYRKAYNSKGTARTAGNNGSKLAAHTGIALEVEAIQAALEATKYQNANQIKALVVHQLTQHALNEDNPPAQRIRALELLGKTHEVGLFVERKETLVISSSGDIKAKLLDQLKSFIRADIEDVDDKGASSLLAELAGETGPDATDARAVLEADPPPPGFDPVAVGQATHSIPLTQTIEDSTQESKTSVKFKQDVLQVVVSIEEKVVTGNVTSENEGGGGLEIVEDIEETPMETPPRHDLEQQAPGGNISTGWRAK